MAQLHVTALDKESYQPFSWSEEQMAKFWENPDNSKMIIGATPAPEPEFKESSLLASTEVIAKPDNKANTKELQFPFATASSKLHFPSTELDTETKDDHTVYGGKIQAQSCGEEARQPVGSVSSMPLLLATGYSPESSSSLLQATSDPDPNLNVGQSVGKPVPVSDDELQVQPYSSVGKFYWAESEITAETKDVTAIYYQSAFCTGNGFIITVAHAFDFETTRSKKLKKMNAAYFVPAMKNKEDYLGENFGYYTIKGVHRHHLHVVPDQPDEMETPQFDICKLILGKQRKRGPDRNVKETEEMPTALSIIPNLDNPHVTPNCDVLVLGYGKSNSEGKMMKVEGKLSEEGIQDYSKNDQHEKGPLAKMTPALEKGMSGGPWLVKTNDSIVEYYVLASQSSSERRDPENPDDILKSVAPPLTEELINSCTGEILWTKAT